jgi:cellobiose epimerase
MREFCGHLPQHIDCSATRSIDRAGVPIDRKKHNYAQAFALYGYSEYYRATGDRSALDRSSEIFSLLDNYSLDTDLRGYREAFDHAWNPLRDARLNDENIIVQRSMNTQVHILEALTNLYRVWPDTTLYERIKMLIELFLGPMYDSKSHHFFTFLDEQWKVVDTTYSYGHDIEASWLLSEAAHVINDTLLITTTDRVSGETAYSVLNEGMDNVNGGLFNLGKDGAVIDTNKQWWAQAEAIVGFFDAYQKTEHMDFLDAASRIWSFAKDKVIDRKYGEWFYRLSADGKPDLSEDKIGPWKCPYHTARACMEIMHRAENVVSPSD